MYWNYIIYLYVKRILTININMRCIEITSWANIADDAD